MDRNRHTNAEEIEENSDSRAYFMHHIYAYAIMHCIYIYSFDDYCYVTFLKRFIAHSSPSVIYFSTVPHSFLPSITVICAYNLHYI